MGKNWIKVFIVAFMVISVTMALPAETLAQDIHIKVKVKKEGNDKELRIILDGKYQFKEARIDNVKEDVGISDPQKFPITLPGYSKSIKEIRPGSVIVFDGSVCIPLPDGQGGIRWLGYPPGTQCP